MSTATKSKSSSKSTKKAAPSAATAAANDATTQNAAGAGAAATDNGDGKAVGGNVTIKTLRQRVSLANERIADVISRLERDTGGRVGVINVTRVDPKKPEKFDIQVRMDPASLGL